VLPRFESPSVFGAMLDADSGTLRLGQATSRCRRARYRPGTMVLETTGLTRTGGERAGRVCSSVRGHPPDAPQSRRQRALAERDYDDDHVLPAPGQVSAWRRLRDATRLRAVFEYGARIECEWEYRREGIQPGVTEAGRGSGFDLNDGQQTYGWAARDACTGCDRQCTEGDTAFVGHRLVGAHAAHRLDEAYDRLERKELLARSGSTTGSPGNRGRITAAVGADC